MPELPDVAIYTERIQAMLAGHVVEGVRQRSPFLLRSVSPPLKEVVGRRLVGARRLGKRVVLECEGELFLVIHLMVAGRLRWRDKGVEPSRDTQLLLDLEHGTLILTEAGKKRRASLHVVQGEEALSEHDPGGLELHEIDASCFAEVLRRENHTLKRALTDPRAFSGIGGAFGDEILHRARLSPVQWTSRLSDEECERLFLACREVLDEWVERTRQEVGSGFPEKVTAFREGMAVHGRYGQPCPVCADPVQRIVYVGRETNYCATCQTDGRVLKDRALSQLLKGDWPRTLEELEALRRR